MISWREGTYTMTPGEIVEYARLGDNVVLTSNLAKNAIHLNYDQASDLISGVAEIMNQIHQDMKERGQ